MGLGGDDANAVDRLRAASESILEECGKVIVGQKDVMELLLIALLSQGHALLVGVPGLAKTLMIRTLADSMNLTFNRVQFTPDLMPSDITGTEMLQEDRATGARAFRFLQGPIFANVVLADEINRTPPKTQAALLEAMQEKQVTAAGVRYPLEEPFFVLATQNPIEMEGTYPLPEAQLDRFMFNVVVDYLPEQDEVAVVMRTTGGKSQAIEPVLSGADVIAIHDLVRTVPVAEDLVRYAVQLASASRPRQATTPDFVNDYVGWGAGLRAAQFLILGAKARALIDGRAHVTVDDIKQLAAPVLRHRILINYRAEAAGVTIEQVIQRLLETVKAPGQ